jgi:hypothetical protein
MCFKLPSMSCKGYLINMSNMFNILFIRLCIWPLLLGELLRCQKLTSWRYWLFPFFVMLYMYLMRRYLCRNKLLRLIARSLNWLYSLNLWTCLFLWLNNLMNKLLWRFGFQLFFKASCDYSWHLFWIIYLGFLLVNKLVMKISKLNIISKKIRDYFL